MSRKDDGPIPEANVLGRVTRIARGGKPISFGLGVERVLIAWLVRHAWLLRVKALCAVPRRAASAVLLGMQSVRLCRALGRRWSLRMVLAEPSAEDMAAVDAHFDQASPTPPPDPDPTTTNHVARIRTKVVGFVQFVRRLDRDSPSAGYWLCSLVVRTRYRGLGIGEALARRVIEQAQREAATELLLAVFEDNTRAIGLYRKLGFQYITLPALEPELEADRQRWGRRRYVMRRKIETTGRG